MASQTAIALVFVLVLVNAATTLSFDISLYQDKYINLTPAQNEELQFLAKFAVDKHNEKNGGSHLYFIEALFNNSIILQPYYPAVPRVFYVWIIYLKAKNCTSGSEDIYSILVTENLELPGQIQAYNSNFTSDGKIYGSNN